MPRSFSFGPFTLDERSGELRKGPTRLKVPDQSVAILQALLERPGELVTREQLRDRLWPADTHVDYEAGLNAAVRRLREALNDSADTPQYVETLPRRGYRFIAPVEGVSERVSPVPLEPASGEAPLAASPRIVSAKRIGPRHAIAAVLALTAIGVGVWVGPRWGDAAPTPAARVPITRFPGLEIDPAISPDGKLVAFAWAGENGDNFDIYIRPIDGSSLLRLTTDAALDHAPAWAPDGQRIAFVRISNAKREIVMLPALGGAERRLIDAAPERAAWMHGSSYGLRWTPDGAHLVFGDRSGSSSNSAIHLYSFASGERRQLTHPPAHLSDVQPAVSPNGHYLAFVRMNPLARGGSVVLHDFQQLHVSGEPRPVTSGPPVLGFDWAQDSRSVVHDAGPIQPGLWRADVAGGAPAVLLQNVNAFRPSVARSGSAVVYQSVLFDLNIWELPTPRSGSSQPARDTAFRVVASTSPDSDMQLSPDGTRIAFASHRSGHSEMWVSNRDGSQATQLTTFAGGGRVGSPSWSADGKRIAFDAIETGTDTWNIHIAAADGGLVKALTSNTFNNVRPSWSIDGRWIYFGSDRSGEWQIWRMPTTGGDAVMITRGGGIEPVASWDGRRIYYAKQTPAQGIWEVLPEGGEEVQVVSRGRALNFDVAENGIFMMDTTTPQATIEMFSFSSRQLTTVARLPAGLLFPSYLRVTRDGTSMFYVQFDQWHSDIEMLPGVR